MGGGRGGVTGGGSGRGESVGERREKEREKREKRGRMFTSGAAPWHFHWGGSAQHTHTDPFWIYREGGRESGGEVTTNRKGQRKSCGDVCRVIHSTCMQVEL